MTELGARVVGPDARPGLEQSGGGRLVVGAELAMTTAVDPSGDYLGYSANVGVGHRCEHRLLDGGTVCGARSAMRWPTRDGSSRDELANGALGTDATSAFVP